MRGRARPVGALVLAAFLTVCREPVPPPVPAVLAIDRGPADSAAVGSVLSVAAVVSAADGRPVRGATVTFAVAAVGGSVAPMTAVTDRDGRATTTWTIGPVPSINQLSASIPEIAALTRHSLRAVPGPPATLDRSRPPIPRTIAGIRVDPAAGVRVLDRFGNGVGGIPVRFSIIAGDGSLGSAVVSTGGDGLAVVREWTTGRTPGPNTVVAQVAGLSDVALTTIGEAFNATVLGIHLNQGNQDAAGTIGGIAGRPGMLRVLVGGSTALNPFAPAVRLRLYVDGVFQREHRLEATGVRVPTSPVLDDRTTTWDLVLDGADIVPGLMVEALVDPDGTVPDVDRDDDRFPRGTALHDLDIRPLAPLRFHAFPVLSTFHGAMGNVTEANLDAYLTATRQWIPTGTIETTLREPFITDADFTNTTQWGPVLGALQALRTAEGASDAYYHGIIPGVAGVAYGGLAYVPGANTSAFRSGLSYDRLAAGAAGVVAHELGHNLGRPHAPCGNVGAGEAAYPHANARLGAPGFDILAPAGPLVPSSHADFMSYCGPKWASDHAFARMLTWRRNDPRVPVAGRAAIINSGPALLVWGRLTAATAILEPAVTLHAAPTPPVVDGNARVRGIASDGTVLFDVAVEAAPVDHPSAAAERHFAHVVALSDAAAARLDRLELSDDGRVTVRRAAPAATPTPAPFARQAVLAGGGERLRWDVRSHPAVFLRDPRSGRLTGVLRGGVADFDAATSARGLQLLVSDGLRTVRVE